MVSIRCLNTFGVVTTWFVLNISIANVTKWTYVNGQLCTESGCRSYKFPLMITAMHMAMSYIMCSVYLRLVKGWSQVKPLDVKMQILKVFPLAFCFAISVAMNNASLQHIYPSLNQMLASVGPLVTVILSVLMLRKQYNLWTWGSMVVISAGLMLSAWKEANFHVVGVLLVLGSTVMRCVKSIIQAQLLKDPSEKMDSITLLFYMSPYGGTLLCMASLCFEGTEPITIFWDGQPSGVINAVVLLSLGGLNACLLNIANFSVTAHTSAVTLQVLGNVKSCLAIPISVFIFRNRVTPVQLLGVAICMLGVYVYQTKKESVAAIRYTATDTQVCDEEAAPAVVGSPPSSEKEESKDGDSISNPEVTLAVRPTEQDEERLSDPEVALEVVSPTAQDEEPLSGQKTVPPAVLGNVTMDG